MKEYNFVKTLHNLAINASKFYPQFEKNFYEVKDYSASVESYIREHSDTWLSHDLSLDFGVIDYRSLYHDERIPILLGDGWKTFEDDKRKYMTLYNKLEDRHCPVLSLK